MTEMTGARLQEALDQPGKATARAAISGVALPARAGTLLALSVAAALTFGLAPLLTSNQNQYFLHGLARAGIGLLRDDWLAQTADPTPVFSALVALTQQFLHPALFYAYYAALAGAYVASLIGIARHVADPFTTRGGLVAYLAILLGMHSALLSRTSLDMVGLDVRTVLTSGVAGQSILGDYLQPSAFGVLLAVSVFLFIRGRGVTAALTAAAAAVVHPTYLLHAGILVGAYLLVTYRESRAPDPLVRIALAALLPAVPVLAYVLIVFRPTSPEALGVAQDVLMHVRLPHHLLLDRWLNLSAYAQIVIVAIGLYAVRRTPRLFAILGVCALAAVLLTVVQALSRSATLALLFPWRLSVLLVPICSSMLAAVVLSHVRQRVSEKALLWAGSAALGLLLLAGGTATVMQSRDQALDPSVPVMNFVRRTKARGDLYLVPISLERFRLGTEAPIFVDRKSIPYRDVELVEWHRRYTLGRQFHLINDAALACRAVAQLPEGNGITHVVLRRGLFDGHCSALQVLYQDDDYGVYRLAAHR